MSLEKLEKAIKNRAHERVQNRTGQFRSDLFAALGKLLSRDPHSIAISCLQLNLLPKKILTVMASEDNGKDWPRELWDMEEEAVRKEILDTMDSYQKAMMAPEPKEDDIKMEI